MTNLKYEVWMNNVALSSLSGAIFISSIGYQPASMSVTTSLTAGRDGERIENIRRKGASVTVQFYLKKTDNDNRQRIIQDVAAWAEKGVLHVSDRPDMQLHVLCIEPPYLPETCEWTTPISMVFQAFEHPFWEEKTPFELQLSGTTGSGFLYVPGNAGKTVVEATVTPATSMADITLTVGDTSITLTGVYATASDPVTITYDENGFLRIRKGTTSILSKRTGSDDLLAVCGKQNAVSFSASAAVNVAFRARGLWL